MDNDSPRSAKISIEIESPISVEPVYQIGRGLGFICASVIGTGAFWRGIEDHLRFGTPDNLGFGIAFVLLFFIAGPCVLLMFWCNSRITWKRQDQSNLPFQATAPESDTQRDTES